MKPKTQIQHFNLGNSGWYDSLVDVVNEHFDKQVDSRCYDRFSDLRHALDGSLWYLIMTVQGMIRHEA